MDGIRRETMVIGRSEHKLKIPVIADDENNQDDEEDDEFCSNRDQVERLFDDDATSHVKVRLSWVHAEEVPITHWGLGVPHGVIYSGQYWLG